MIMVTMFSTLSFCQQNSYKDSLSFIDSATKKIDLEYYVLVYDGNGVANYYNDPKIKLFYLQKYGKGEVGLYTRNFAYAGFYRLEAGKIKFIPQDLKK